MAVGVWSNVKKLTHYVLSRMHMPRDKYKPPVRSRADMIVEELPPLRLTVVERMLQDPQVNLGLLVRNGILSSLEVQPHEGGDEEQNRWAIEQWDEVWQNHGGKLMRAKVAGHAGYEIRPKVENGLVIVDDVIEFHPRDVRVLENRSRPVGFKVRRDGAASTRRDNLFAPAALWISPGSKYNSNYGDTFMRASYSPWYKKWMEHGCEAQTTLFMLKNAVFGDVVWYPPNRIVDLPDGTQVTYRDVMREVVENRMSFGVTALPLLFDNSGNRLIDYTPPISHQGQNPFDWWDDKLGRDIWKGMGILPEVVEALGTGSFSGRSVPFTSLLSLLMDEAHDIFSAFTRDVLTPLAWVNFGSCKFKLRLKPLTETFSDDMGGGMGEQPFAGDPMMSNAAPAVAQFDEGGHWVTIGAKDGDGGTPVKLDGSGRILSGPRGMVGRNVNRLSKKARAEDDAAAATPPKASKSRGSGSYVPKTARRVKNLRESDSTRLEDAIREYASDYNIPEKTLRQAIDEVWKDQRLETIQRESVKVELREMTGITAQQVSKIENSGKDWTSIKNFDIWADSAWRSHPELFSGQDTAAQELWDLLGEGRVLPKARHHPDIVKAAAEYVKQAMEFEERNADLIAEMADVEFAEDDDPVGVPQILVSEAVRASGLVSDDLMDTVTSLIRLSKKKTQSLTRR